MKTEVLPILAPRGGLNKSLPADLISDVEMSDCLNVVIEEGLVKKRRGLTTLGNNLPLAGPVIGIQQFTLFDGTDSLIAVTTKKAYYLAAPTGTSYWETLMANEVIEDCEDKDDWGWNAATVTPTDDAVDVKVGTNSMQVTIAASFTTGTAVWRDFAYGDKKARTFVRFWIKSNIATSAGDLAFGIYETANGASPPGDVTEALDIPALAADTWKLVFLEVAAPATSMDAIASIGINVVTDSGVQVLHIDDIRFVTAFGNVAYDADNSDTMSADYALDTGEQDAWWLMTNAVDSVWKWTGNVATALAALGGTPPVAIRLIEFKTYLLLLDVIQTGRKPQRVAWCDTADLEDWTTGNYGAQDLSGSDWIIAAVKFKGDYVAILKKKSLWLGYATGDSNVFQFDQRVPGIGCVAANTPQAIAEVVIFLGADDVYMFDGIDCVSAGEKIRDELRDNQNPKQILKALGVKIEEKKEYWLFHPSSSSTYNDKVYCLNYQLFSWTKLAFSVNISASGSYQKQATTTIGDLIGTIADQDWRIGERSSLASTPITLFGDTDGNVYEYDLRVNNDNGSYIDGWFSTKDFNPTQLSQRWRLTRIDAYFTGNGMDIEYSEDKGVSWTRIVSFTTNDNLETPQMAYLKEDLLMVRLRFRNSEAGEHFEFSRANLYWQLAGVRL